MIDPVQSSTQPSESATAASTPSEMQSVLDALLESARAQIAYHSLLEDQWIVRTVNGSEAKLDRRYSERMWFSKLRVPDVYQLQGEGSLLLWCVCRIADLRHDAIELSPISTGPLGWSDLVAWYERYGFVVENPYLLAREPQ